MATIDGLTPQTIQAPDDAHQVASALLHACEQKLVVVPYGGRTMQGLGAPLQKVDLALSLEKLNRVIDYQPANLTVQLEAGITLGALNQILAKQGQFIPLDPPFPDRATLGGILASNASGALRLRYGTARDLVIGIRVALANGQIVKGGGQVVKNVAGYDVAKLFIGSLGTLGVIVETTLKVLPLPKTTSTLVANFDSPEKACAVALKVLQSPLLPMSAHVLNRAVSTRLNIDAPFALIVRFGGLESAVNRQVNDVAKWSRDNGSIAIDKIDPDDAVWARLRDLLYEKETLAKISVLPTQLNDVCRLLDSASSAFSASAVGIVFASLDDAVDSAVQKITTWRAAVKLMNGYLTIQHAPRVLRERVNVWGDEPSGIGVMRDLKREFDPNNILNPGRFIV